MFMYFLFPFLSLSQYPSFHTDRSESDLDSPWGSSPLTDSASPQLEGGEGMDASYSYRNFSDPHGLSYSLSEEQHHTTCDVHTHLNTHSQGQGCERGRCDAGRYFLGAPPPNRDSRFGTTRPFIPLTKSSLDSHDGYNSRITHISAIHSSQGEDLEPGSYPG